MSEKTVVIPQKIINERCPKCHGQLAFVLETTEVVCPACEKIEFVGEAICVPIVKNEDGIRPR